MTRRRPDNRREMESAPILCSAWEAISRIPEGPFRKLTDDELDDCFRCLIAYFLAKKLNDDEAEDAAEDLLVEALEDLPDKTQHYLARVAYRRVISHGRAKGRRRWIDLESPDDLPMTREPASDT